jgi:hypothetical protein
VPNAAADVTPQTYLVNDKIMPLDLGKLRFLAKESFIRRHQHVEVPVQMILDEVVAF